MAGWQKSSAARAALDLIGNAAVATNTRKSPASSHWRGFFIQPWLSTVMRLVLIGGFQGWLLGRCSSFLRGFGGGLGLTLAAAHFTRVVRRTAVGQHDGGSFCLYRGRLGDHRCRLCDYFWLGFDNQCRLLGNRSGFNHGRRLFNFARFDNRRFNRDFGDDHRFGSRRFFNQVLRSDFDHRLGSDLGHDNRLADRLLHTGATATSSALATASTGSTFSAFSTG